MIKYWITPSQLDAFQSFIDADIDWEKYWGKSEKPSKTAEEYTAECEKRLIDQINRCPKESIQAASCGTAFNEVVDMIIHNRSTPNIEMTAESSRYGFIDVLIDGFRFQYDTKFCKEVAKLFPNALSQYLCGAELPTQYGEVWLYGYIDEWSKNKIYDIKTTSKYDFGKYGNKWQRHLYPYCITEEFPDAQIEEFEFTVVKFNGRVPLRGEIFPEVYTYNHEQSTIALTQIVEQFIGWLESKRGMITDKKIFGGKNEDGYIGTPIDSDVLINT